VASHKNQQTKSRKTGPADSIAEGKLARVELIAREALDILGEESPEKLRKDHAAAVAEYDDQITNLEHRLQGAAEQIKSVEGELRHSNRLAADRLEEAERVWDVAAEQANELKAKKAEIGEHIQTNNAQTQTIAELKLNIKKSNSEASKLRSELIKHQSQSEALQQQLESKLEDASGKAGKLESFAEKLKGQLDELSTQVTTHEASLIQLTAELASTAEERDEALSQYEHAESQLSDVRDELAERSARLSEAQAAVTIAREQIAEIETRAEISDTRADELELLNRELSEAIEALKQAEVDTQLQITTARGEMADLSGRIAERDKTIASLSKQVGTQASEPSPTQVASKPAALKAELPEDQTQLMAELDARNTEAAYIREQMERADSRAELYKERMESSELALEKAHAIVMRARRRASLRTQQYSDTIEAMSALHVRYDVLKGELSKAESMAGRHLLIGRLSGAAAIMAAILALISAF
jgi:chromosome segregation protein